MPEQLSDEVAFHEGFTCFSEEEWQLLQDWRNTFHKNMMQEIDHAMMLLGPLIANMVSSSRAKITQEFCITDNQDSGDRPEYEVVSVRIKNEDDTSFLVPENSVRLSVSTTMDSSVCIKEEGVTCPVDVQGYSSGESFNSDDNRNKNGKLESLVKCNRISRLCKSTVKQFKANRREETALWQKSMNDSILEKDLTVVLHVERPSVYSEVCRDTKNCILVKNLISAIFVENTSVERTYFQDTRKRI
ncbi:hypothetical protein NDU88_003443 [Pleurodeles waltl]|uniref:KRAB domain-containing protein n=1 Tax=Pleurodeles waltl TaxID=8319 RepID=A0AAV7LIK7_PLEWA|nr:hypothetical protein NDU88_003443 [Pleurodeles waltl]